MIEQEWMTYIKDACPDEIGSASPPVVEEIREQCDRKFAEVRLWFWEQIDANTTAEEKKMLYNEALGNGIKKTLIARYNDRTV